MVAPQDRTDSKTRHHSHACVGWANSTVLRSKQQSTAYLAGGLQRLDVRVPLDALALSRALDLVLGHHLMQMEKATA